MNTLRIGHIIDGENKRDAIHVAVVPMIANHLLSPGEKVGIVLGQATSDAPRKIGVVDPFLDQDVRRGQWFWMFLTPGEAKNLRHEWDHPDLASTTEDEDDGSGYDECRGCD